MLYNAGILYENDCLCVIVIYLACKFYKMIKEYPHAFTTLSGKKVVVSNPEKDHYVLEVNRPDNNTFAVDWFELEYQGTQSLRPTDGASFDQDQHEVLHAFWQEQR